MGYSSRILAESWESNTLYWAALADELSLAPAQLNVRIPEWTGKLVEHIFASHLEDWPALLRSLRRWATMCAPRPGRRGNRKRRCKDFANGKLNDYFATGIHGNHGERERWRGRRMRNGLCFG